MTEALTERLSRFSADRFTEILALIGGIDEIKGWWQAYSQSASHLLGAFRQQAQAATAEAFEENMKAGSPVAGRITELENDVVGVRRLWLGLLESVLDEWKNASLCEELILDLHARLSTSPGGGAYRTRLPRGPTRSRRSLESIALDPSRPERIAEEVRALTEWTKDQLESRASHPLLVIAGFLLEFLAIQPFSRGNDRIARILANVLLMQTGYSYMPYVSLEQAIASRRTYYDIALRNAMVSRNMSRPDISSWLTEFLRVLRNQAVQLRMESERHPQLALLSVNQIQVMGLFALHHEITVRLVVVELQLSRDTAKQVLSRLHSLGLVRRFGSGRAVRYRQVR
jgi:Fic family protein